jgi:hypothetical protein
LILAFGQDALQRAAVHVEATRGLGNVVAAEFVDALDVFPANAVSRHRVFWWFRFFIGRREQRFDDVFGIGRFGEIIERASFDCGDCGGDGAVSGQHHDAALWAAAV